MQTRTKIVVYVNTPQQLRNVLGLYTAVPIPYSEGPCGK